MGRQKTVPIRRFQAVDEEGQVYHIVGSEKLIEIEGHGPGEPGWTSLGFSLRTVDGLPVTYLAKGVYEVQEAQPVRVTTSEPRAP